MSCFWSTPFHQLLAQAIDGFTLLVHDVVVLEDVLAGLEVLGFDGLLRGLDAAGDHAGLRSDAFLHAETLEKAGDPLAGEDAHQVVFEREIEAAGAGVALPSGAAAQLVVDAAGLMPLCAEDVEAAGGDDGVVLGLGGSFVGGYGGVPGLVGGLELLAVVVEAEHAGAGDGLDRALGGRDGAGLVFADEVLPRHEVGVAAEQDVGSAAGHVGGDGHHAQAAGLGYDLGFFLMELGVEDDVADALLLEDLGEELGLFDACGADQDGLLLLVQAGDLIGDGEVLFLGGAEDDVGVFDALHLAVGGGDDDVELVDLVELGGFGLRGAGHAAELFVHAGSSSGR